MWLWENTWPGYGPWEKRVAGAMEMIEGMLGRGALGDAPYTGSLAHRPRYYWSNIARHWELMALVPVDYPLASLDVVLKDFHTPAPVVRSDGYPFRPVNLQGQPRRCISTLVSYPRSRAFKQSPTTSQRGPREVYNTIT